MLQACLDLQLQFRPPHEIDGARFDLWLRQLVLDASVNDWASVSGDIATLEWIRDRIARAFDPARLSRIDTLLNDLRTQAGDERYGPVARTAVALRGAAAA